MAEILHEESRRYGPPLPVVEMPCQTLRRPRSCPRARRRVPAKAVSRCKPARHFNLGGGERKCKSRSSMPRKDTLGLCSGKENGISKTQRGGCMVSTHWEHFAVGATITFPSTRLPAITLIQHKHMSNPSIALIVGASRGLGLGLVREYLNRGWRVIATERRPGSSAALAALATNALSIEALDIDDEAAIAALAERLAGISLHLLYVNAGVCDDPAVPIGQVATAEFDRVMRTNALGPMRVVERLSNRVAQRGTIAIMTSALGSVSAEPHARYDLYGASKAALNRLMRGYAVRAGGDRTLLLVMPGWVKTDMGGDQAPLDIETSVRGIADAIAVRSGNSGLTFVDHNNTVVPW